ncbi:Fc.00g048900.m01.CDS01 [Cosmosporella sp. VM-42]
MSFQMRKATRADVEGMCSVYFSAFGDTIIGRQVFPQTSETVQTFWREMLSKEVEDVDAHFFVVIPSESPDTIVAFAKWLSPGAPIEDAPSADIWPKDGNPALANEFFTAITEAHQKIMGGKDHYYLELIAVRKEWMGKGAASSLMRWGVNLADAEGLPCFLEATPNARPVYEKYGFRVVSEDELESSEGKILEYYMLRDSK